MPYTLMKGLGWFLLALLLGIVIGWLLRSVAAKRQVARARNHHVDTAEMERLRGRVANLEPVVAERDRLRAELDTIAAAAAAKAARKKARTGAVPDVAPPRFTDSADAADAPSPASPVTVSVPDETSIPSTPDVAAAGAALGRAVVLDDLKVVEGIGPKIESLCHGIGIRTWYDLSTTEVSLLRTMLADAGPRFRTHDPGTWPEQARLLAEGRWQEFRAFVESLQGGRADTQADAAPDAG